MYFESRNPSLKELDSPTEWFARYCTMFSLTDQERDQLSRDFLYWDAFNPYKADVP